MHPEVIEYMQTVKERFPDHFEDSVVIEYGSKNINGSVRTMFEGGTYVGVNRDAGPGVDVVSRMHEYEHPCEVDVVVTTSTMEHDKYLWESCDRCWEMLRSGGLFCGTTVNPGFPLHCPGEGEDNHYAGVEADDLRDFLSVRTEEFEVLEGGSQGGTEVWFWAVKP